ncbi:MAG: ATP-binding protein, partial [Lachnospiraceae bacterium]|nr:ATP-binding protein [Lachnospiraceae bacterium]
MGLKAEDVFRPGAFPEYTYISRKSTVSDLPYEFRLMQAIKVSGFLTSLVGPSKMGKTILCEKVIGFEKIVEVSGADFSLE